MPPPGLFESTAVYYARYRPGYPPEAIDVLVDRFRLGPQTTVLDLGCGTGQIAIPLAQRRIPVCAIDPDEEMLSEGRRAEASAGGAAIRWLLGDDRRLATLDLHPLMLCAMGASFHWMDRGAVLRDLDALILPGGGVAVLSAGRDGAASRSGPWLELADTVVKEFLGAVRRAGATTYSHPDEDHATVLRRSAFSAVESLSFKRTSTISVDEIIGLQLSMSFSSPVQLGSRLGAFIAALRERLLAIEPSGQLAWDIVTEVLVAKRPGPVAGGSRQRA
jgi:SAM-dependent methyltransferase